MNLVGKIFVFLNLFLAVAFMAMAMMVYATHKNFRTEIESTGGPAGKGWKTTYIEKYKEAESLAKQRRELEVQLNAEVIARERALAAAESHRQKLVADLQQVTMELEAPTTLPVVSDPELIRQLIGNLISNAIRYNRPGGTVWLRLGTGDSHTITVVVQDSGIGIPTEHQERIFERFYRVDAHRSRQSGGTGLGLAIIKQLLDVLGGTIALRSDSTGTCFTVTIPQRDPRTGLTSSIRKGTTG